MLPNAAANIVRCSCGMSLTIWIDFFSTFSVIESFEFDFVDFSGSIFDFSFFVIVVFET